MEETQNGHRMEDRSREWSAVSLGTGGESQGLFSVNQRTDIKEKSDSQILIVCLADNTSDNIIL